MVRPKALRALLFQASVAVFPSRMAMDIPHHRADAHSRTRSEVIVSARTTQLDTIGSPPAVAIPRHGGSVRRVSSSLRAVTSLGKVPVRVGATPVPHAGILDHVRDILARQGFDLQIEI